MFSVHYHFKVRSDFRKIGARKARLILDVIESKLAEDPEQYGKPLRQTLKNCRSLRIGDYRVVYTVEKKRITVLVLIVGKRDKVYKEATKRLKDG